MHMELLPKTLAQLETLEVYWEKVSVFPAQSVFYAEYVQFLQEIQPMI